MKYFEIMEYLQSPGHLNKHIPDLIFFEELLFLLVLHDLLVKVTPISELHHNASAIDKITKDFCPPERLPYTRLYLDI